MKKLFLTLLFMFCFFILPATATEKVSLNDNIKLHGIGFHKKIELTPELQIKQLFKDYQKYTNDKSIDKLLMLHDDEYISADGYNKNNLITLANEAWREFPDLQYNIKVLNVNVDLDNATVITQEKITGTTKTPVEFIKGDGFIVSESTAIYYLKRCSNSWKIVTDFVLSEKSSLRYGVAKYIPMTLDAPSLVSPNEEYTAILKVNQPRQYVSLISIGNEPIVYPAVKCEDVFRPLKTSGIQERVLRSNNGDKNENAVASVGVAKADIENDNVNISFLGMAFLSSRVNVLSHKYETVVNMQDISNVEGVK